MGCVVVVVVVVVIVLGKLAAEVDSGVAKPIMLLLEGPS